MVWSAPVTSLVTCQATSVALCAAQAPVLTSSVTLVPSVLCAVQAPVSSSGKHLYACSSALHDAHKITYVSMYVCSRNDHIKRGLL